MDGLWKVRRPEPIELRFVSLVLTIAVVCCCDSGAIGSQYKIDASYLSPNVNISARLEAATKQYGTTLLISGSFVAKLSQEVCYEYSQRMCGSPADPSDLMLMSCHGRHKLSAA